MRILMVCLGNICRSPMAEGIMREMIESEKLNWNVDSAGTGDWHVGEPPDPRSVKEAARHNIDISHLRGRQLKKDDFDEFDLILVMDESNYQNAAELAPQKHKDKLRKLLSYNRQDEREDVPDPYFEGGFDGVYRMIHDACEAFIEKHKPDA